VTSARAARFGRYWSCSMASRTRWRVESRMLGWSLMTRDTVCRDTPATRATSRMLAGCPVGCSVTDMVPRSRAKAAVEINADPQRTMSFTMFAQPDYYFQPAGTCPGASQGCLSDKFAWIHGDYSNDIGQTWLGMAGPGVKAGGLDDSTWSDHTDIVPTVDALTGLSADYTPDGRVITQVLTPSVAKGANGASFTDLGNIYKQLDAPYGAFAHSLIVASTNGIKSDDATYLSTEQSIKSLTADRDSLVDQMRAVLDGTANGHREQLIRQGQDLLSQAAALAGE